MCANSLGGWHVKTSEANVLNRPLLVLDTLGRVVLDTTNALSTNIAVPLAHYPLCIVLRTHCRYKTSHGAYSTVLPPLPPYCSIECI